MNYNIIRVRYYASDYLLKKWHDGGQQPMQHWDRAKNINELFWNFVKLVTGKTHKYFLFKWMFETKDCVIDYLYENYDIIIDRGEKYYYFILPKTMEKEFKWVQDNSNAPYEIMKRKNLESYKRFFTPTQIKIRRDHSEKFTKESSFFKSWSRRLKLKRILNDDQENK